MARGLLGKLKTAVLRALAHFDASERGMGALDETARVQLEVLIQHTAVSKQQLQIDIENWRREELALPRYSDPRNLNRFEHRFYSQDGGDGILREIFRRIGEGSRYFVEFGVGGGLECNSALLLVGGWSGTWIEGNPESVEAARTTFAECVAESRLTILNSFITAENVEDLFRSADVPEEPALLSIDIDGNDYWVWNAITSYRPRVVEIEYNAMFPADAPWIMKYNPEHVWAADSYSGASLCSLTELAESRGYRLVACSLAGINAFYVRSDLIEGGAFVESSRPEDHYQPPRYHLVNEIAGNPRAYGPSSEG